ncbi:hypothetical protein CSUI_007880, partial [Cystoisospora suis]
VFGTIPLLQKHYKDIHYPCPHTESCPLTVFRTDTELYVHLVTKHGTPSSATGGALLHPSSGRTAATSNTTTGASRPVPLSLCFNYRSYKQSQTLQASQNPSSSSSSSSSASRAADRRRDFNSRGAGEGRHRGEVAEREDEEEEEILASRESSRRPAGNRYTSDTGGGAPRIAELRGRGEGGGKGNKQEEREGEERGLLSEPERRRRRGRESQEKGNEASYNNVEKGEEEREDDGNERETRREREEEEEERHRSSPQEKGRRREQETRDRNLPSSSSLLLPPPPGLSQGRVSSSPSQFSSSSSSSSSLTISAPPGLESREMPSSSSRLDSFSSTTPAVLIRCLCTSLSSAGRAFLRQELQTGCMYTSGLWEGNELRSIEEVRDYAKKTSRYLDALSSSFPYPSQQVQETVRLLKEAEKKWRISPLLSIPRESSLLSSISSSSRQKKRDPMRDQESRKREDATQEGQQEEQEEDEEEEEKKVQMSLIKKDYEVYIARLLSALRGYQLQEEKSDHLPSSTASSATSSKTSFLPPIIFRPVLKQGQSVQARREEEDEDTSQPFSSSSPCILHPPSSPEGRFFLVFLFAACIPPKSLDEERELELRQKILLHALRDIQLQVEKQCDLLSGKPPRLLRSSQEGERGEEEEEEEDERDEDSSESEEDQMNKMNGEKKKSEKERREEEDEKEEKEKRKKNKKQSDGKKSEKMKMKTGSDQEEEEKKERGEEEDLPQPRDYLLSRWRDKKDAIVFGPDKSFLRALTWIVEDIHHILHAGKNNSDGKEEQEEEEEEEIPFQKVVLKKPAHLQKGRNSGGARLPSQNLMMGRDACNKTEKKSNPWNISTSSSSSLQVKKKQKKSGQEEKEKKERHDKEETIRDAVAMRTQLELHQLVLLSRDLSLFIESTKLLEDIQALGPTFYRLRGSSSPSSLDEWLRRCEGVFACIDARDVDTLLMYLHAAALQKPEREKQEQFPALPAPSASANIRGGDLARASSTLSAGGGGKNFLSASKAATRLNPNSSGRSSPTAGGSTWCKGKARGVGGGGKFDVSDESTEFPSLSFSSSSSSYLSSSSSSS